MLSLKILRSILLKINHIMVCHVIDSYALLLNKVSKYSSGKLAKLHFDGKSYDEIVWVCFVNPDVLIKRIQQ